MKVTTWSPDQAKKEISKRWHNCQDARVPLEDRWQRAERTVYANTSPNAYSFLGTSEGDYATGMPGVDSSDSDTNVAYAFKNIRFIHAQMSANPPSVVMRPTSSDQEDRRRADAADRVVRYAIRQYEMQERVDQSSLQALVYGTAALKCVWDSGKGEILGFDEKTGELKLEGDICVSVPHIWNIFIDPDAEAIAEIKYVIERLYIDYDEACARWPDKEDLLKKSKVTQTGTTGRHTQIQSQKYNVVELLEYWETGLPTNGYLGRYAITTIEGDQLQPVGPNPHRFLKFGAARKIRDSEKIPDAAKEHLISKIPEVAQLPFHFLTDVDVPNRVWGKSLIDYIAILQGTLNKIDSATVDNIQAHGVARMVIPETAEIADDSLTNSPWDVTKMTGSQPPFFMEVPQLMPEMTGMRQYLKQGIDDMSGVNESMFGQQSREQSGASMQYATNQGNMIRRRLFNKYVLFVEGIYKSILNLVRKHWDLERTIYVLGKEKALEAVDLKGMDIDGGYDVVGEYGVSLSLDPLTRREEIMALQPLFEKAGVPTRVSLKMMKLNELEGMYDLLQLAEDRQREIFEEIIARGVQIQPKPFQDHQNMIGYAMQYFMTTEFVYLEDHLQDLCREHVRLRAQQAALDAQGGQAGAPGAAPGMPPGGAPAPAAPPPPELAPPAAEAAAAAPAPVPA